MKNFVLPLFAVLLAIVLASPSFAQPSSRTFYYEPPEPALTTQCQTGDPLPDGTQVCIYWDNNHNGPDITDIQPPAQADSFFNQICWGMNGEVFGDGPGYFVTDPAPTLAIVPTAPDTALYYFRITTPQACWTSAVYYFGPGLQDIFMTAADWTCSAGPCQVTGEVPNAPTNVSASDDSLCLAVRVYWDHDSLNVSGFNIYDETGFLASAGELDRSWPLIVPNTLPHAYYVRAVNNVGESDTSNIDSGSTYLIRFAEDLTGNNLAGEDFTIHFSRPEAQCPAIVSLFILDNQNVVMDSLCADSFYVDSMTCTLPEGQQDSLRLMLSAYSVDQLITFTDTTQGYFSLGGTGVDDRNLLVPDHFALEQNYPNPFNPTTTIDFAVPYQSDVKIEVYNIAGQLVKTLVNGNISAGVHHIAWDGLSQSGVNVSSGLYFYRMTGPGFVSTKKMLMMK